MFSDDDNDEWRPRNEEKAEVVVLDAQATTTRITKLFERQKFIMT
jgi:hypothetical protein